jgi:hypothetical protein
MKYIITALALLLLFEGVPARSMEADSTHTPEPTTVSETLEVLVEATEELDDVRVNENTVVALPGKFSLAWRSLRERVQLLTTFDAIKKAELELRFAAERETLATAVLTGKDRSEITLARAASIIARSEQFVSRATARIEAFSDVDMVRAEAILERLNEYELRVEERIARLEARADVQHAATTLRDEARDRLRQTASSSSRLLRALDNEALPEEARATLEVHAERIEDRLKQVQERREQRATVTAPSADTNQEASLNVSPATRSLRGQDYNSSRSNKARGEAVVSDTDDASQDVLIQDDVISIETQTDRTVINPLYEDRGRDRLSPLAE